MSPELGDQAEAPVVPPREGFEPQDAEPGLSRRRRASSANLPRLSGGSRRPRPELRRQNDPTRSPGKQQHDEPEPERGSEEVVSPEKGGQAQGGEAEAPVVPSRESFEPQHAEPRAVPSKESFERQFAEAERRLEETESRVQAAERSADRPIASLGLMASGLGQPNADRGARRLTWRTACRNRLAWPR